MHPVLEVPEILCLIFKCGISEYDLFNCALVCRVWGTWAVDVLWRTCRVPLQQVLQVLMPVTIPGKISYDIVSGATESSPIVDFKSIDEREWRRFIALSNKISQIEVDCGVTGASLERIELAKRTFNGEPFSQLQTLQAEFSDGDHEVTSLVTVPSLTRVYLLYETWEDNGMDWLNNKLPVAAPNITHFGFVSLYDIKLDVSCYSALKYIEVCINRIRAHFWESLGSCRLLTKVLLSHCMAVAKWGEEWHVEYIYFPALRTFKIRGMDPRDTLSLILRSRM